MNVPVWLLIPIALLAGVGAAVLVAAWYWSAAWRNGPVWELQLGKRLVQVFIALAVLHAVAHTVTHYRLGCRGAELLECRAHVSPLAWED